MPNFYSCFDSCLRAALTVLLILGAADLLAQCADTCRLGAEQDGKSCQLWDSNTSSWQAQPWDGSGHLHNRARVHTAWLRERLMPVGGVMGAVFTDDALDQVALYVSRRDSAIWTGVYLAAESLRLMTTDAPDAAEQIAKTVQTLHRWWTISGDPGYLARYAAPAESPAPVLAALPADDDEVQRDVPFNGGIWHWRGRVSRDQYQGVLLGYSLAYQATDDPQLRELIRSDIVTFVEQLMRRESREVEIWLGGIRWSNRVELEHVVYTDDETDDGKPIIEIDPDSFDVDARGLVPFWPKPSAILRDIPGLGWLPDIQLPTQAIQLAAAFTIALQVTEGIPAYAGRRAAIAAHYQQHASDWLGIAVDWRNTNRCGDGYFGLNIAFLPAFSWARLETDPARRGWVQRKVLRDALWNAVATHKNVHFAFSYASQAPAEDALGGIIDAHVAQLRLFPPAPQLSLTLDLRGLYPQDPACPGLSTVAANVDQRAAASFIWERQPWNLYSEGTRRLVFPGIDFLLPYWMGRYQGFIEDDAPGTCLDWRFSGGALDIDGDGTADALTDGLLIVRYLLGYRNEALVQAAIAPGCTRCDHDSIHARIEQVKGQFDLDADESLNALTDGQLLIRYLFGYRGAVLTQDTVAPGCKRCDAQDISEYAAKLLP